MKRLPTRHGALLLAAGGHAALLWPLLASPDAPPRLATAPVMTVSLVAPAQPAVPTPIPPTPRPPLPQVKPQTRPQIRPLAEPQPVARTPEPAPVLPASPLPPAAAPAALPPSVAAAPAPPAPPATLGQAAEAPVVEARFDAAYLNNPKPAYPPLARRLGEEGQVLLRAYVSADGRPEQIELRRSSGSPRLDAAAQETVRRWRFVPARRGDAPTAAWVLIPINFRLDS